MTPLLLPESPPRTDGHSDGLTIDPQRGHGEMWDAHCVGFSTLSAEPFLQPVFDFRLPPSHLIHRYSTALRKLTCALHTPYRRPTQANSLPDFPKWKKPRKSWLAVLGPVGDQ